MLPLKPPYNVLHFINILLSPNICAFRDTEIFLHSHPIFPLCPNLTFLTSESQKFKFDQFLPRTLSPTQNEPKESSRSQINPHLDHETAVHILLEYAVCRCFDLACTDMAHLSPNRPTHLKSPKKLVTVGVLFSFQRRVLLAEFAQFMHPLELTISDTGLARVVLVWIFHSSRQNVSTTNHLRQRDRDDDKMCVWLISKFPTVSSHL